MTKLMIVVATCLALFMTACAPSPQTLILGILEIDNGMKIAAEFHPNGTAKITMFGQTLQGTYKLTPDQELEWNMNGITTKSKAKVTLTELEITNDQNQTVKYKRK